MGLVVDRDCDASADVFRVSEKQIWPFMLFLIWLSWLLAVISRSSLTINSSSSNNIISSKNSIMFVAFQATVRQSALKPLQLRLMSSVPATMKVRATTANESYLIDGDGCTIDSFLHLLDCKNAISNIVFSSGGCGP